MYPTVEGHESAVGGNLTDIRGLGFLGPPSWVGDARMKDDSKQFCLDQTYS